MPLRVGFLFGLKMGYPIGIRASNGTSCWASKTIFSHTQCKCKFKYKLKCHNCQCHAGLQGRVMPIKRDRGDKVMHGASRGVEIVVAVGNWQQEMDAQ